MDDQGDLLSVNVETGPGGAGARPVVALLLQPGTRLRVWPDEAGERLRRFADVIEPPPSGLTAADLPALLAGATAAITGWGTPSLETILAGGHPTLRLLAHTAGTLRGLIPWDLPDRGIAVTHSSAIMADAVAELVIGTLIVAQRDVVGQDRALRDGAPWPSPDRSWGRAVGESTVAVVGAGYVGRRVIALLRALGARVLVADPLLDAAGAADLGVELVALPEAFARADVVSLHAPVLPETRGMIDAALLARLRDGGVLINTARSAIVDEPALLAELATGRFTAILDVFPEEPLPTDSPYRRFPNVLLTPHIGGQTDAGQFRQGLTMVEEIRRWSAGEPLRHEVTRAMMATMA